MKNVSAQTVLDQINEILAPLDCQPDLRQQRKLWLPALLRVQELRSMIHFHLAQPEPPAVRIVRVGPKRKKRSKRNQKKPSCII